ncbi:beta strand repeat-containing protein, partial [Rhodoblastus acidophilus]|uniref:beta strand repeat-containing protein n=1 Tax=Rhodoblastus acidophilus TaxID=1074 RepID=UPI0022258028
LPNAAGTTLAIATSLGALSSTAVTKSDWVGAAAPDDYYSFTLASLSSVALNLSGQTGSSYVNVALLDSAGNQIDWESVSPTTPSTLLANLAAGTYYVHIDDPNSDTAYTLTASATATTNQGGATLASAKALGTLGTVTVSDSINTAAPVDYYSFTVGGQRPVALQLTGLTSNATLTLFDASGQRITTAYGGASSYATILKTLAAGQYFAEVSGASSTTAYKFVATTTPILTAKLTSDTGSSATDLITNTPSLTGTGNISTTVKFTIDGVAAATTATSTTTGAWTYVPTGLADGKHTVIVSETDPVGDVGATSLTFTLDTTPPTVTAALVNDTGVSGTDKVTSAVSLSGTADANAVVSFTVDGVAATTTATANASGAWTFTPSGLADGVHTIVASQTDIAGNVGKATLTVTRDITAPAVTAALTSDTGASATDKLTSNAAVSGSGDPNAVVSFTIDGVAASATATADATGAWSFAPTGLADGQHTIVASETDLAGNAGSASLTFTLDATAPVVTEKLTSDTGVSSTDKITSNPALSGSGEANAVVSLQFDGGAVSVTTTADAAGAWSYAPTGLADGAHTVIASETDAAGNAGSVSLAFTLDKTAPVVAAKLTSDTGASSTDKITSNPGVSGSGDPNAVVSFVVDGVAVTTTATADATGAWSFAPTGLADGAHTIVASETDAAGNKGSASLAFTLDKTAPVVTEKLTSDTGASATDKITSKAGLSGTGQASAVVKFVVDGVAATTTATADATGAWTYAPTGLADGAHTVVASETDVAGNTGSASLTFTLDTKAPVVTAKLTSDTGSSATDKITSNAALSGTGDPNAVVRFTIDGVAATATATANASGAWTYAPTGLADGAHTIVASQTDAAGNVGSASLTFTLDTKAPAPTIGLANDTGASSSDKVTTDPSLYGLGDPNAVVRFTVDGVAATVTATAGATGAWSYTPTGLAVGAHTIVASETDAAGNVGTASLSFTLASAPVLSPKDATVAMGASVAASSLFSATLANGDAITTYEFIDANAGASSGSFVLNGVTQSAGGVLDVAASDIAKLKFVGGSAVGVDDIWVRASNALDYGNWIDVQVQTQGPSVTPPTIAAGAAKVAANASLALASLFQVTDPNGLAISEYQFVDLNTSATSGHIALGTTAAPAGQIVDFPSALLPTASFAAGAAGSVDTLAVRAYDGGAWSAWTQFTVTTTS